MHDHKDDATRVNRRLLTTRAKCPCVRRYVQSRSFINRKQGILCNIYVMKEATF
jgi:hypothetical protein